MPTDAHQRGTERHTKQNCSGAATRRLISVDSEPVPGTHGGWRLESGLRELKLLAGAGERPPHAPRVRVPLLTHGSVVRGAPWRSCHAGRVHGHGQRRGACRVTWRDCTGRLQLPAVGSRRCRRGGPARASSRQLSVGSCDSSSRQWRFCDHALAVAAKQCTPQTPMRPRAPHVERSVFKWTV